MKKLIILLGVVGTAFSAILVRSANAPSAVLVFYRMLFAVLLLLPVTLFRWSELRHLRAKDFGLCAVSGLFLGLHFICYFVSLEYTGIASAVVLVDTEVFFVALGGILFLREKIEPLVGISIVITFVGSAIVASADMGGNGLLGDAIALCGALCSAVYTLIGRKCRERMSTTVYTWIVYFFAGLVALGALMVSGVEALACGGHNLLIALGLTVLCTLLGHSIFSWGLKYEKAAFISTAKLLEPVFAALLGIFFFREIPSLTTVAGGMIIIAGIYLYINESEKSKV